MARRTLVGLAVIFAGAGVTLWFFLPRLARAPEEVALPGEVEIQERALQIIRASDIPGISPAFTFRASVPAGWQAEAVTGSTSVSFYDPEAAGSTVLDKSQIFMRTFEASDFLTLATVTIHAHEKLTINGRPAVRYDIEKRPGVAAFPAQPAWRNARHIVTDIRVSDSTPSIFYVIAKQPDLDEATYQAFLENLELHVAEGPATLVPPIAEFTTRITKKPFGIYITPETSPVQPERFIGWHTGADVEYGDVAEAVPVYAIAPGHVVLARIAGGYGGVVAIQHEIRGEPVVGIYGHLQPASLPPLGQVVSAGDEIGLLGEGETAATDGARKHLHFALRRGAAVDIRGYVAEEKDLHSWYNPLEFYS